MKAERKPGQRQQKTKSIQFSYPQHFDIIYFYLKHPGSVVIRKKRFHTTVKNYLNYVLI